MRIGGLLFLLCSITACGNAVETDDGRKSKPDNLGAANPPAASASASQDENASPSPPAARKPAGSDPRQVLLQTEWDAYADLVISHNAASLPEGEREVLRRLSAAGRLIEELYMLELNPDNLKWRDALTASGTEVERRVFFRNQMPWCEDNPDPTCSAYPNAGPKRIGRVFWPESFDDKAYEALSREINAKELLSPFTVVREKTPRGYTAIPAAGYDAFGPKMRKVAAALRSAAEATKEPTLKKFLMSRADAFVSLSPFPYDDSDYDWIALEGDWEVTVGPYETYKMPFQTKALFEMLIGREDKALTQSLQALKKEMPAMDAALSTLVGENIYKPRALDPRIAVRAVEVWAAFGDARQSRGAILAYHLPNRGKSVDEGLYKKVILVNHAAAFEAVNRARGEELLDAAQVPYISFRDGVTNTAYHELSHGFGAYHEMRITDKEGRLTTVKEALREYDSLLEELKADTMSLWLSTKQREANQLDEETLRKRYVTSVVHLLGLLQYPLEDTYTKMAAVLLGRLYDDGAIVFDAENGKTRVVYEKMGEALSRLLKDTATIQLTGDGAGAKLLVAAYCKKENTDISLVGSIKEVRLSVVERIKKRNIKSPSLRYEVLGL